jgi:hypothetical protein
MDESCVGHLLTPGCCKQPRPTQRPALGKTRQSEMYSCMPVKPSNYLVIHMIIYLTSSRHTSILNAHQCTPSFFCIFVLLGIHAYCSEPTEELPKPPSPGTGQPATAAATAGQQLGSCIEHGAATGATA